MSSAAKLVVFVVALARLTSCASQDPTPTQIGIEGGAPNDDDTLEAVGTCDGTDNEYEVFECSGEDNYLKWNINYCNQDFKITSTFKAVEVDETDLAFVLWEGTAEYHIGLDGTDQKFFFEQGNEDKWDTDDLGPTTLQRRGNNDAFQTIELHRDGGKLSVKLDGAPVAGMQDLAAETICVDAVGWKPMSNTIRVQDLFEMQFEVSTPPPTAAPVDGATPPPTSAPVDGSTVLTQAASAGDTRLAVNSEVGFEVGNYIEIEGDGKKETAVITEFGTIVIANGLNNDFPEGAAVNVVQAEACGIDWNTGGRRLSTGCKMECEADGLAECGKTCCELYEETLADIHDSGSNDPFAEIDCGRILQIVQAECAFCASCDVEDADRLLTDEKWLLADGLPRTPRAGQWSLPGAATTALAALGAATALGAAAVAFGRQRAAPALASARALDVGEGQSDVPINSADC